MGEAAQAGYDSGREQRMGVKERADIETAGSSLVVDMYRDQAAKTVGLTPPKISVAFSN